MKIQKIYKKIEKFIKENDFLIKINKDVFEELDESGHIYQDDFDYYVEKGKNINDKKVLGLFLWIIWFDLPTKDGSRWPRVASTFFYSTRKTGKEDDIVIRENKVDIHDEDVRGVIQENIEIGIEDGDEVTLKDLNRVKKEVRLISKFIETLNIPSFKTNPAEGLNPGKKYNQCSITDIPHEYRNEYGTNDISLMVNKNNGKSYELHYLVEYNKKYNKVSSFFYDFKANKAYDSVGYDSDIPWDNYSSFMH